GVDVADAIEILDDGMVDMAADDAVCIAALGLFDDDTLKLADEVDGMLDLKLRPGRKRPVGHIQAAANRCKTDIDQDRHVVGPVAEIGEQTGIADDDVEFVAMQDEISLAV